MSYSPLSSLKNILEQISELVSRLAGLSEAKWVLNDIRVTPTGNVGVTGTLTGVTTVATVTTVGTVSNQTSMGWYLATPQIPAMMNIEATLANIDNIIIS